MEAEITSQAVGLASSADFSILKLFSKRFPVIFFTCHEQQADLLRV